MPFVDPWLAKGQPSPIETERRWYVRTDNALHVWRAYQICRQLMRRPPVIDGLPEWIMLYFDAGADMAVDYIRRMDLDPVSGAPAALLEALKIKKAGQGIRTSAFSDYDLQWRDFQLALEVETRRKQGKGIEQAYSEIEKELRDGSLGLQSSPIKPIEFDAIRAAHLKWRSFFEVD